MGLFGTYTWKKEKKSQEKWWLHVKDVKKAKFYYFSRNPEAALPGLPAGYEVTTNPKNGLPMLKKRSKTKK